MNKKTAHLLELELVIILAVTILLGGIIGYSLAAASKNTSLPPLDTGIQRLVPGEEL